MQYSDFKLKTFGQILLVGKLRISKLWRIKIYGIPRTLFFNPPTSVTSKNSPNVYKSCPKIISLEKLKILTPLQKLPKNVGDLGKLIVATVFEKLPKSNKSPNLVTLPPTHGSLSCCN